MHVNTCELYHIPGSLYNSGLIEQETGELAPHCSQLLPSLLHWVGTEESGVGSHHLCSVSSLVVQSCQCGQSAALLAHITAGCVRVVCEERELGWKHEWDHIIHV